MKHLVPVNQEQEFGAEINSAVQYVQLQLDHAVKPQVMEAVQNQSQDQLVMHYLEQFGLEMEIALGVSPLRALVQLLLSAFVPNQNLKANLKAILKNLLIPKQIPNQNLQQ